VKYRKRPFGGFDFMFIASLARSGHCRAYTYCLGSSGRYRPVVYDPFVDVFSGSPL